ncbi:MAG: hypothetical protein AB1744_15960, partial [Candidatus Zixiibacteriota bacterium]
PFKKKSRPVTGIKVIDSVEPSAGAGTTHAATGSPAPDGGDLETVVLGVIKEDPFASIREIQRQAGRILRDEPVSWWRVFITLRRLRLLTRRSRFRLFRRSH